MFEEGKGGVELCNELGFRFLRQLEDILKMQGTLRSPRKIGIHQELQVGTRTYCTNKVKKKIIQNLWPRFSIHS
jgi:hypothetical protein